MALRPQVSWITGPEVSSSWPRGAFGGLTVVATVGLLAFLLVDPVWLTRYINRAPLLPIVLGIWIPVFTYIHACSLRTRTPLILGFVLAFLVVLPWLLGDAYNVRSLGQAQPPERPSLFASIERWAKVNNCDAPSNANGWQLSEAKPCPRPIIVLAAGGASRAAFKVAEVLGNLANVSDEIQAGTSNIKSVPPSFRSFQNRLFAISAVSGGALAAVTYQAMQAEALLARSSTSPPRPPCRKAPGDNLWFGSLSIVDDRPAAPDTAWNSCMQLMLAGDFLSPTVVSLIGTDLLNVRPHGDRAATLEIAWERRFEELTGNKTLAEPMVALRNRVLAADDRNWIPHLLINGTSVSTGRRIITTDLDPLYGYDTPVGYHGNCRDKVNGRPLRTCSSPFRDAYDLHDLMSGSLTAEASPAQDAGASSGQTVSPAPCTGCDIRLSTAATMSARFPVLSPHGTIRNADGSVVDRVVDGGYFENNGAVTAHELAISLRRHGLSPLILLITNEPSDTRMSSCRNSAANEPPKGAETTTFALLSSPFSAFIGTRSTRGTLASLDLCFTIENPVYRPNGPPIPAGEFIHFGVWQNSDLFGTKQLSMSWWLSKYVQRSLTMKEPMGPHSFPTEQPLSVWQVLGLKRP